MDNPLSLNLYTYVQNTPLTRIDPIGHDFSLSELNSDAVQIGRLGYNSDRAQTAALFGLYAGVAWQIRKMTGIIIKVWQMNSGLMFINQTGSTFSYVDEGIKEMPSKPSDGDLTEEEHFF